MPSERAKAYKMRLNTIKRQVAQSDLTAPNYSAKFRSDDEVGSTEVISGDTVRNIIALNNLIPELMQRVDDKETSLTPAYQIASLTELERCLLLETIDSKQATPSVSKAQRMRKLSQMGELTKDNMLEIMKERNSPRASALQFRWTSFANTSPNPSPPTRWRNPS